MRSVVILLLVFQQTGTWDEVGGSATGGGITNTTNSLFSNGYSAMDAQGNPTVAWVENNAGFIIYLKRWNGSAWEELGGSATGTGFTPTNNAGWFSMGGVSVDSSGNPVVLYREGTIFGLFSQVYLLRWSGSAWVGLGGSDTGEGISQSPGNTVGNARLALDANDNPVVAWSVIGANGVSQVFVKRWNGSAWVEYGGSGSGDGVSNSAAGATLTDLELDAAGNPAVVWSEGTVLLGTGNAFLRRWNGSTWEELGGSGAGNGVSNSALVSTAGFLAIDSNGNPVVAWQEFTGGGAADPRPYLKRWNGTAWEELGGSASGAGITAGGATVAGDVATTSDGQIVLSWVEDDQITLKIWNGTSWQDLGNSGGGLLSGSVNPSRAPTLATTASGFLSVVWIQEGGANNQVHLRRWSQPFAGASGGGPGGMFVPTQRDNDNGDSNIFRDICAAGNGSWMPGMILLMLVLFATTRTRP